MAVNVRKKRVSKKNKVSWRKHIDLKDVDDFLEEKRLEERLGKFELLTNDELFTLDNKPTDKSSLSSKGLKRLRALSPPKCFAALQPHTKTPDPIAKRNHVRTKEERMCPILKKKELERRRNGILKAKELQSLNDRRKYEADRLKRSKNELKDIWDVNDTMSGMDNCEWLNKETVRHNLRGLGQLRKIAPRPLNQKLAIPGVEPPHPGTSYNPSFEDHQNLLQDISQKELKIIKDEEHYDRVTKDVFRKITVDEKDNSWLREMSEGLSKSQDEDDSDGTYHPINPAVVNKKKTLKQRRKQKEQAKITEAIRVRRLEKKKIADMHKLKQISKAIENREMKLQKLRQKRLRNAAIRENKPKRLGRLKYEDPDVEFNMATDIAGNLRNVKKEGDLLVDRLKSMQRRNILEVTSIHTRKKSKTKTFKKVGFADGWKKTVAKFNL